MSGIKGLRLGRSKVLVVLATANCLVLGLAAVVLAVHQPNHVSVGRGLYRVAIANCNGPNDTSAGCNITLSIWPAWEDVGIPGGGTGYGDETSYLGPPISASIPITIPRSTGRQLVEVEFFMGTASCRIPEDASPAPTGPCTPAGLIVAIPTSGPEIQFRPTSDFFAGWQILTQGAGDWSACPPDRCTRRSSYPMAGSAVLKPGSYTIAIRATLAPQTDPDLPVAGWVFEIDSWHMKVSQYNCGPSCG